MKLKFFFITFFAVIFFYSCATTGQPEGDLAVEEVKKDEVITEEVVKEPVKIVTTVYFPVKEESYFGDGTKDDYRLYTYNEDNGFIIREELFGSDDKLDEYSEYEYREDGSFIRRDYDSQGNSGAYTVSNVDSEGNVVRVEKYNSKDQLQSRSDYEYDGGLKTKWSVYGASLNLLSVTEYSYEGEKLVRIESFGSGGSLEEYYTLEYDNNGLLVKNSHFEPEGSVIDSQTFEYKDGFLVMEKFHRKNGSVKRKVMFTNDENGNPVEKIYMDAGNNVSERIVTTYGSREEISYEK